MRAKGTSKPIELYELLGRAGEVDARVLERAERYEQALTLYQNRDFEGADALLGALAEALSDDRSVARLRELACDFQTSAPDDDWDGVTLFQEK